MTVPALHNAVKGLLTRAGVDNPDGDAREILCAALSCSHTQLILRNEPLTKEAAEEAMAMARRRAEGEPLQYVLGSWTFMGRRYSVGEGVLIPRDDTEVAVREALAAARRFSHPSIVDLCAGSGIIAITLDKELDASVTAVEISETAFRCLEENIRSNTARVKPILADLSDCVSDFADGTLDMIVSNPPYIRSDEIAGLQKEVLYEPRLALDGGADGYDFYRTIISLWSKKLKPGGVIVMELGEGQYQAVAGMLNAAGYTEIRGTEDIQGTVRAVTARYRE